jgi:hypothetical protein
LAPAVAGQFDSASRGKEHTGGRESAIAGTLTPISEGPYRTFRHGIAVSEGTVAALVGERRPCVLIAEFDDAGELHQFFESVPCFGMDSRQAGLMLGS